MPGCYICGCLLCNTFASWAFSLHSNLNCLAFSWKGLKVKGTQCCSSERKQNPKQNHPISLKVLSEVSFIQDARLLPWGLWSYLVSAGNKEPFSSTWSDPSIKCGSWSSHRGKGSWNPSMSRRLEALQRQSRCTALSACFHLHEIFIRHSVLLFSLLIITFGRSYNHLS